jgi:hypothetical protein
MGTKKTVGFKFALDVPWTGGGTLSKSISVSLLCVCRST